MASGKKIVTKKRYAVYDGKRFGADFSQKEKVTRRVMSKRNCPFFPCKKAVDFLQTVYSKSVEFNISMDFFVRVQATVKLMGTDGMPAYTERPTPICVFRLFVRLHERIDDSLTIQKIAVLTKKIVPPYWKSALLNPTQPTHCDSM